jgi:hypothetical protein
MFEINFDKYAFDRYTKKHKLNQNDIKWHKVLARALGYSIEYLEELGRQDDAEREVKEKAA